jgi:hypothetical protein
MLFLKADAWQKGTCTCRFGAVSVPHKPFLPPFSALTQNLSPHLSVQIVEGAWEVAGAEHRGYGLRQVVVLGLCTLPKSLGGQYQSTPGTQRAAADQ